MDSITGPPGIRAKGPTAKKPPTFLSPRWFFLLVTAVFSLTFWRGLLDPDKQAVWQVSSVVTLVQAASATAAWGWLELNAPWAIKALTVIGAVLKAIVVGIATVLLAVWNIAFNS